MALATSNAWSLPARGVSLSVGIQPVRDIGRTTTPEQLTPPGQKFMITNGCTWLRAAGPLGLYALLASPSPMQPVAELKNRIQRVLCGVRSQYEDMKDTIKDARAKYRERISLLVAPRMILSLEAWASRRRAKLQKKAARKKISLNEALTHVRYYVRRQKERLRDLVHPQGTTRYTPSEAVDFPGYAELEERELVGSELEKLFGLPQILDWEKNAIPSSSKDFHHCTESLSDGLRTLVFGAICGLSKFIITKLNTFDIHGQEELISALEDADRGVITVSNHTTAIDDPGIVSAMTPWRIMLDNRLNRWGLCAEERCFKFNQFVSDFFTLGKVIPVKRSLGLEQPAMNLLQSKLESHGWVHLFPEGTRSKTGKLQPKMKVGIGRLVAENKSHVPLVVPIYHIGTDKMVKNKYRGAKVTVLVGRPIDFSDVLRVHRENGSTPHEIYRSIADIVGKELSRLEQQAMQMESDAAGTPRLQ